MKQWPVTIPSLVLIVSCLVAVAALGAVPPEIAQKVQTEGIARVIARNANVHSVRKGDSTRHRLCRDSERRSLLHSPLYIGRDGWNPRYRK